jgi:hypothetical protein
MKATISSGNPENTNNVSSREKVKVMLKESKRWAREHENGKT